MASSFETRLNQKELFFLLDHTAFMRVIIHKKYTRQITYFLKMKTFITILFLKILSFFAVLYTAIVKVSAYKFA